MFYNNISLESNILIFGSATYNTNAYQLGVTKAVNNLKTIFQNNCKIKVFSLESLKSCYDESLRLHLA